MGVTDEIKSRIDIATVARRFADLKQSGRIYKANCPFHSEKTPSFVVNPQKGSWRCFGACDEGGDVFGLLMKAERIEFKEALVRLARETGVELAQPKHTRPPSGTGVAQTVNEVAAKWFAKMLASSEGQPARQYLEQRGVDLQTARRRGIGYATGGLMTLKDHLRTIDPGLKNSLKVRLVNASNGDEFSDFFRERLTFEIRDAKGVLAGFGARSLGDAQPKYINTPQTALFDKSSLAYGLNWAHASIQATGTAIVVEGYMDVVTAHENGFENVVAAMGVAITRAQIQILARQLISSTNPTVVICLDADNAGQSATLRALEEAWVELKRNSNTSRIQLKVAQLTQAKDPDQQIRQNPALWRTAIEQACPAFDYLLKTYATEVGITTPEGKSEVVNRIKPLFGMLDQLLIDDCVLKLSATLNLDAERLKSLFFPAPNLRSQTQRRVSRPINSERSGRITVALLSSEPERAIEDHLLALLLNDRDLTHHVQELKPDRFYDPVNRAMFEQLCGGTFDPQDGALSQRVEFLNDLDLTLASPATVIVGVKQCATRLEQRYLKDISGEQHNIFGNSPSQNMKKQAHNTMRELKDSFQKQEAVEPHQIIGAEIL